MNKVEYLLTCLVEECAEIQKDISKALRFGLMDDYQDTTNKEKIEHEVVDLIAVYQMLVECEVLCPIDLGSGKIQKKKDKMKQWMAYSSERKCLTN